MGVPFNIASYSLLTHIVANLTGLIPGRVIGTFGDAHIYRNHINGNNLFNVTEREPYPLPTLDISNIFKPLEDTSLEGIKEYLDKTFNLHTNPELCDTIRDELKGYVHHPKLKFDVAV